jgi:SOS-response transcriptional repressor LexA
VGEQVPFPVGLYDLRGEVGSGKKLTKPGTDIISIAPISMEHVSDRRPEFAVRVKDASMRNAGIKENAILIVMERQPRDNEIVIVQSDAIGAVARRYNSSGNRLIAEGDGGQFPDLVLDEKVEFLGVVQQVNNSEGDIIDLYSK